MRGAFRPSSLRTHAARVRNQSWRQTGRRTYASGHGPAKASSDLPWLIGSVVVTVPSAAWLWQQGPKKGDHGHEQHEEGEEHEEEGGEEESKDDGGDGEKEVADEDAEKESEDGGSKDEEAKDEGKSDDSESEDEGEKETPATSDDDEGYEKPGPSAPGQINKNDKKGPGELQKGERKATEKQGEKDAQKDHSGAKNPYIDDPEKSKKGEGVTDTAKIHGTVDTSREAR